MNFNQVGALVTGNTSALQGLVTGLQGSTVDAAAAGATRGAVSQAGVEPGASGNATERMLGDARNLRGGFTDGGAGQVSAKGSCDARAANSTAGSQNNTDPSGDENKRDVPLSAGGTAYVYPDGSFVIKDASGKQEVYDSNYRERTSDPRWTANKTPVPDGEGGAPLGTDQRRRMAHSARQDRLQGCTTDRYGDRRLRDQAGHPDHCRHPHRAEHGARRRHGTAEGSPSRRGGKAGPQAALRRLAAPS